MVQSILWELTELPGYIGGTAGLAFYCIGVLVLGVVAPVYLGLSFMSTRVLLVYTFLPLLFAPPLMAESLVGERNLKPSDDTRCREWIIGKVGAGAVYGWLSVIHILALAFLSLGVRTGRFPPPVLFVAGFAVISFASSLFAASLAAVIAMGSRSARSAKRTMRQGLLLLVVVVLYVSRQPWEWTRRFAIPASGDGFLGFASVIAVFLVGFSMGLVKLAQHSAASAEIRLNL